MQKGSLWFFAVTQMLTKDPYWLNYIYKQHCYFHPTKQYIQEWIYTEVDLAIWGMEPSTFFLSDLNNSERRFLVFTCDLIYSYLLFPRATAFMQNGCLCDRHRSKHHVTDYRQRSIVSLTWWLLHTFDALVLSSVAKSLDFLEQFVISCFFSL